MLRLLAGRVNGGSILLDVGSGPGFSVAELARMSGLDAGRWILVDPQRSMLTTERGRRAIARFAPRATRVVADATELPLPSGSVDVVLSLGVLCCMTDAAIPAAVAETARVLKPGGLLLLGIPPWRGTLDEARVRSAGFVPVASLRPGRGLLQKTL